MGNSVALSVVLSVQSDSPHPPLQEILRFLVYFLHAVSDPSGLLAGESTADQSNLWVMTHASPQINDAHQLLSSHQHWPTAQNFPPPCPVLIRSPFVIVLLWLLWSLFSCSPGSSFISAQTLTVITAALILQESVQRENQCSGHKHSLRVVLLE